MSTPRHEALALAAERVEADAWRDARAATPPADAEALGFELTERDGAMLFKAPAVDSLLHNRVLGLGLHAAMQPGTPRALLADFAGVPGGFAVNLSPLAPRPVGDALTAAGFASWFHHLKHVRDAAAPVPSVPGLQVTRARVEDAELWSALAAGTDGAATSDGHWSRGTLGRSGWTQVMAWDGDMPIAGAALFVAGEWGWLGWAHTAAEHRGRGAQRALLAARVHAAREQGARWLTTETGPDWEDVPRESLRNVRWAGFATLYERPSWIAAG